MFRLLQRSLTLHRFRYWLILLALLASAAGSMRAHPALAQTPTDTPTPTSTPTPIPPGTAIVAVSPAFQVVSLFDPLALASVTVQDVSNLGSYEFIITWNPAVVSFISVTNGPFLGSTGRSIFCPAPVLDTFSVPNSLQYGCASLGSSPPGPSGSGVLAILTFAPAGVGATPLDIFSTQLSDPLATDLPAAPVDGVIEIFMGPTPTATNTFTPAPPTATPTPIPPAPCGPSVLMDVCLGPQASSVVLGSEFSVDILVDDVLPDTNASDSVDPTLGSFEFDIAFDPAIVSAVEVRSGAFLGSTGRTVVCVPGRISSGSAGFSCVTLGSPPPLGAFPTGASGTGVLASVVFTASAVGVTAVTFSNSVLLNPLAEPLPHTATAGSVEILPCSGPCPTPVPTRTPTPTAPPVSPTATITPFASLTPCAGPCPTAVATATPVLGATVLRILPVSQSVYETSRVSVAVEVQDVVNLGAFEITIGYDPALLSFVSATGTTFLSSTGRQEFCMPPGLTPGTVTFSCVTLGSNPPNGPSGTAVIINAEFDAIAPGLAAISIPAAILFTPQAQALPAEALIAGTIEVLACSGACPTPTSTATPGLATSTPTPGDVAVGSIAVSGAAFALDIVVSGAANLGSYEFEIQFDGQIISPLAVVNGAFLGSSGRTIACTTPIVTSMTVRFGCFTVGSSPAGPTGNGVLATVSFSAGSAPGVSSVDFNLFQLSNPLGATIPSTASGGTLTVASPTPAVTSTYTPTPGGPTDTPTTTPTATATNAPVPASVGGIAEQPDLAALPFAAAESRRNYALYVIGAAAGIFAAAVAVRHRRQRRIGG